MISKKLYLTLCRMVTLNNVVNRLRGDISIFFAPPGLYHSSTFNNLNSAQPMARRCEGCRICKYLSQNIYLMMINCDIFLFPPQNIGRGYTLELSWFLGVPTIYVLEQK